MKLSVVTALYESAPYIEELHTRISSAARAITDDYEIVFVNDGSPDESLEAVLELHAVDPHVRVIDLSRNFGQHKAILTGLAHTRGDLVFLIDSDLEEDPEWLSLFYEEMLKTGADVVYGVQDARKGGFLERITGDLYYYLYRRLSDVPVPANQVAARLMTRRYVDSLVLHRDQEVFLAGLWALTGYQQDSVPVRKSHKGSTSYTFRKKVAIALNSVTSFSKAPLVAIFYVGMVVTLLAIGAVVLTIVAKVFFVDFELGWPSLIISIWFLGGITLSSLGVIGMYLSKVFIETKQRPYTTVRHLYDQPFGGSVSDTSEDGARG